MATNYLGVQYIGGKKTPRGLRNNNPGNIIRTKIAWNGKIAHAQNTDDRFEQFKDMAHGVRALYKQLHKDIEDRGMNLKQLLNKYAPSFENNTANYISRVEKETGISATQKINLNEETLKKIAKAIVKVEIGADWVKYITDSDYNEAMNILGLTLKKKLELE
jgi:hypothetical protein